MEKLSVKISESKLKNYSALKVFLRKNKFIHVGAGSYASCYSNKNVNYVIKVFEKGIDLPYWSYLKRIRKSKNPYMPKVYGVIKKRLGGREYILVILEKLICWEDVPSDILPDILEKHFGYYDIHKSFDTLHKDYEPLNKPIKRLFNLLNDICNKWGYSFDNHKGNIMYRKKGVSYFPVFIDPLFNAFK